MKNKAKEWFKRYLPGEAIGTFTAITSAWLAYSTTNSFAISAVVGTIGENVGYYGYFTIQEFLKHNKTHHSHNLIRRVILILTKTSRNLLIEFGPAELFDSSLVRPALMFIIPQYISPYILGVLIAKLLADLVFYGFAIIGYEIKKLLFKEGV